MLKVKENTVTDLPDCTALRGHPVTTVQNPKAQSPAHSSTTPEGCEEIKCILRQNKDKKKNRLIKILVFNDESKQ